MNPEEQESQPQDSYSILCGNIEYQLSIALENAKALDGLERGKKEARRRMSYVRNALSSARHHLGKLERIV